MRPTDLRGNKSHGFSAEFIIDGMSLTEPCPGFQPLVEANNIHCWIGRHPLFGMVIIDLDPAMVIVLSSKYGHFIALFLYHLSRPLASLFIGLLDVDFRDRPVGKSGHLYKLYVSQYPGQIRFQRL